MGPKSTARTNKCREHHAVTAFDTHYLPLFKQFSDLSLDSIVDTVALSQ